MESASEEDAVDRAGQWAAIVRHRRKDEQAHAGQPGGQVPCVDTPLRRDDAEQMWARILDAAIQQRLKRGQVFGRLVHRQRLVMKP